MSRSPFHPMTPGQDLEIYAREWNAFLEAAVERNVSRAMARMKSRAGTGIPVKNDSGYDVDRFGILGIDDALIAPGTNTAEFQTRPGLSAITPDIDVHANRFVVFQEPVTNGKIGPACVSGPTVVQIEMSDASHQFATITDGERGKLSSATHGLARILWVESGTGTKWALVDLGADGGTALTPVLVEKDGGSDGDGSTAATWTYTVRGLGGDLLGEAVPLSRTRPAGQMTYQSGSNGYGTAFWDGADLKLWDAGEVPTTYDCEGA